MARVPLLEGAYAARSYIAAAQRCLNLYPERNPQGEDSPTTLYLTPGLSPLGVPPQAAPVRGLYRASNGQLFSAVGNGIYYVAPDWTSTLVGTTAVNTTPVKMGDNGTTTTIVDGSAFGWLLDLPTHNYSAQSDPNFFGSNFVESLDTFQLFNKPGTNIFYCSLSNSAAFDPLYFAAKVGYPDLLAGIAVQNRNPWLIGAQQTSEIWFDAGATDFPFQIMPGPFVEHGTIATYSLAKQGGSVFWLSQDANGTTIVVEGANFTTNKISTPALENEIGTYSTVSDAIGFCYEQIGHAFYWLKFPSANNGLGKDWLYDLSTKQWHERSWMNPGTCEEESHRALCHAFAYGINVVGDRQTGQLYMLDLNNQTDAGAFIERRRGYPHSMADGARASYPRFIADMEAGTAGGPPASLGGGIPAGLAPTTTYPASVTVIDTTFAAPDGVLLQDYFNPWGLADTGSQYTKIFGTTDGQIEGSELTGANTGAGFAGYLASGIPTSADYIAQFQAVPNPAGSLGLLDDTVWLLARSDPTGESGYQLFVNSDGTQFQLVLQVMGGSGSTVDMGVPASGYFQLTLALQGDVISGAAQRSEDGMWLASDGTWQSAFAIAIQITDGTWTEAGRVLIGGSWLASV